MSTTPLHGLFITGTDTAVGKTFVTTRLIRQIGRDSRRVGAYKPVCSGARVDESGRELYDDLEALWQALDGRFPRERIAPQCFRAAAAPPVAAHWENRKIDSQQLRDGVLWWRDRVDVLLIEGAGGWFCPVTTTETIADLAQDLGFPVLIVAHVGLGTINHTLLTVEAVLSRGLECAGIVLNQSTPNQCDPVADSNPEEIAARSPVPVLGVIPYRQSSEDDTALSELEIRHVSSSGVMLRHRPIANVNWLALTGPARSGE